MDIIIPTILTRPVILKMAWTIQLMRLRLLFEGLGCRHCKSAKMFIFVLGALVSLAAHRYYTAVGRRSLLADLAMVFTPSSLTSGFIDVGVRGFTVDFIELPGYVVADVKDVLIWFGVACLLAEMFDSPEDYWKMSLGDFLRALGRMVRFQFNRLI